MEFTISSIAVPIKKYVWSMSTAKNTITIIFYVAKLLPFTRPIENFKKTICIKFQTLKYSKGRSELSASLLCFRNPSSNNSPQIDNCIKDINTYLRINIIFIPNLNTKAFKNVLSIIKKSITCVLPSRG